MTDTSELAMLRDSARGALADFPDALGLTQSDELSSSAVAKAMALSAAQGWTAMLLSEELGGLGVGLREGAIVAEELGRALAPGPFLVNAVLIPVLAAAGERDWLRELAAEVAAGGATAALCFTDEGSGPTARRLVEHAIGATSVLRLALSRDSSVDRLALWRLFDPNLIPRESFDPACPIAELDGSADAPPADALWFGPEAAAEILGVCQIWIAADLLGVAERTGEMSIAHASSRRQFGQLIGANQAIKHRIVDDYVLRQNARVIIAEAALAWDEGRDDRLLLAHAARAAATTAAIASTSHCIQVHGAFGFSAESTVHLAYKRVRRLGCTLGDEAQSRAAIAARLLPTQAA